jgi:histidinol-phosphate aminotransferase
MLSPRRLLANVPAYHPPLAGRNGLRLDFNENTVGCSPRVIEKLRQITPEDIARYPVREAAEETVAKHFNVRSSEVLLTNGVDEAIHLLCQSYLDPGDDAMIVEPTYSMYRIYMAGAGAEVTAVNSGKDFGFPADELCQRIASRTRLIAIANPNNPTGAIVSADDLRRIARSAPNAAVLVDEAYFEFYGETLLPERGGLANLFVTRTFSKAYGLAGLRLGVLAGDAGQLSAIRRIASPYSVNAVALACLPAALADEAYVNEYVRDVRESRCRLEQFLDAKGIRFWKSHANFVLVRVGASRTEATAFVAAMRRRGILIRDRSGDVNCEGCVRITLGPREHPDRLLAALDDAFAELGITSAQAGASRA